MSLEQFKKDFKSWSGFDLEETERDEIIGEIKSRQWQMECDLDKQSKRLQKDIDALFPDEF